MNLYAILGIIAVVAIIGFAVRAIWNAPEVPTEEQKQHDAVAFDRNEPITMGKQSIINRGGSRWADLVGRLSRKRK